MPDVSNGLSSAAAGGVSGMAPEQAAPAGAGVAVRQADPRLTSAPAAASDMMPRGPAAHRLAAFAAMLVAVALSGAALADPRGVWLTPGGKSHVEIAPCGSRLCGRIVWLREPNNAQGRPLRDARNKDESLRSRPILGLPLLTGLPQEPEDGVWDDGDIYNPEDGKTYSSELEMKDQDTLKVSGCVWFFCQSQIWKRVR